MAEEPGAAEMAANASLVRPLALVGAKLTTCIAEPFAAVPPRRPCTSDEAPLVKPMRVRSACPNAVGSNVATSVAVATDRSRHKTFLSAFNA